MVEMCNSLVVWFFPTLHREFSDATEKSFNPPTQNAIVVDFLFQLRSICDRI